MRVSTLLELLHQRGITPAADTVLIESTYGDRQHEASDPLLKLGEVINRTAARGGVVVIPAFAVGRAQNLMYCIHLLKERGVIHHLPVYLDSPMATDATRIYHAHRSEHRLSPEQCEAMCHAATIVNKPDDSRALSARRGPMVIISASGMATGGRVLHHLKALAPDRRNTIIFAGYQAGGTRGGAARGGWGRGVAHEVRRNAYSSASGVCGGAVWRWLRGRTAYRSTWPRRGARSTRPRRPAPTSRVTPKPPWNCWHKGAPPASRRTAPTSS